MNFLKIVDRQLSNSYNSTKELREDEKSKEILKELKEEAVKLLLDGDRSIKNIAQSLGVHGNNLSRWKAQFLENPKAAFLGYGNRKDKDDEVYKLKKNWRM